MTVTSEHPKCQQMCILQSTKTGATNTLKIRIQIGYSMRVCDICCSTEVEKKLQQNWNTLNVTTYASVKSDGICMEDEDQVKLENYRTYYEIFLVIEKEPSSVLKV
jgi:ABC-type molybdenum transport system ATPase subunit/photorepair protein PhrA